jgi:hypothetical protein
MKSFEEEITRIKNDTEEGIRVAKQKGDLEQAQYLVGYLTAITDTVHTMKLCRGHDTSSPEIVYRCKCGGVFLPVAKIYLYAVVKAGKPSVQVTWKCSECGKVVKE